MKVIITFLLINITFIYYTVDQIQPDAGGWQIRMLHSLAIKKNNVHMKINTENEYKLNELIVRLRRSVLNE